MDPEVVEWGGPDNGALWKARSALSEVAMTEATQECPTLLSDPVTQPIGVLRFLKRSTAGEVALALRSFDTDASVP